MSDNAEINTNKVFSILTYTCTKCDHGIDWFSMSACSQCGGKGTLTKEIEVDYIKEETK